MKLKKIEIKNIASIGEATLHFDRGLLAEANRFLICGDMGTGKSTLLDSICLALYGNTPRLKQAPNDKRNFGNDEITARDPRNLLRHGTSEGSVTLDFEGSDGVNYTAQWSVRRTRNNTLDTAKHTLSYGNEVITNKKDLSDIIVNHAVGLDFDQFCRTTMLAQGQFTQFLKSSENDKSAILEKMTKTDIFSAVGKEIARIRSEKERAFKLLEAEISGANLLSDEEISTLEESIENNKKELSYIEKEKEVAGDKVQWLKTLTEAQDQFGSAEAALKVLQDKVNQPEFQEEEQLIKDWNMSGEGRQLHKDITSLENRLKLLTTTQVEKGADQFELAVRGINDFSQKLEEKKGELKKTQDDIEAERVHENMFANAQTIIEKLNSAITHRKKIQDFTNEKVRLERKLPELEDTVSAHKNSANDIKQAIDNLTDEKNAAQKALDAMHPETLPKKRSELNQQTEVLNKAQNALIELTHAITDNDNSHKNLADTKKEISNENKNISENQPIENEKKAAYDDAKAALEKTKLTLGNEADKLRAQLHVGDICPVCGQKITELLDTENLRKLLQPQEELVNKYEEELRTISAAIQSSQNLVKKYKNQLPELEKNCEITAKKQLEKQEIAQQWCSQVGYPTVESTKDSVKIASEWIKDEIEKLKGQNHALEHLQQKVNNQEKSIKYINDKIQQATENAKNAEVELEKAKNAVITCQKDIQTANKNAEEENKTANSILAEVRPMISWQNWENDWNADSQTFATNLSQKAANYESWKQTLNQLTREIEDGEKILKNVDEKRNAIAKQWPQWESDTTVCAAVENLENTWNDLSTNATKLFTQTIETEKNIKDAKKELNGFLTAHTSISEERLAQLCDMSETDIPAEAHKKTEKAFSTAKGALEQAKNTLENAKKADHPALEEGENADTLQQKVIDLQNSISRLNTQIGDAQGRLDQNKKNAEDVAEKKKKLEQARELSNKWKAVSDLFGSNDGAAFRNIAQSYLLHNLVASANQYLQELTKRYTLDCIPGTLTLCLRDQYQGNVESPVDTLSGGESFLVSLSLALALSSINRQGFHIDTLFIDEGFGNLSSNELDIVMNLLGRLQKMNGKRVGIISHVESVKDHIPVHVEVNRIDPTCSKIEVKNTAIAK